MMMRTALSLLVAVLLADAAPAHAAPSGRGADAVAEIAVAGPRVHLSDLVPSARPELASVDLGPAPKLRTVRIVEREEVLRAVRASGAAEPRGLPASFRIVRKTVRLGPIDAERRLRDALGRALPKGATLKRVGLDAALDLPSGELQATAEIPKPPRRQGNFSTQAIVSFAEDGETVAQVAVPIQLTLSAEAATPDVARGATVTLVFRQGLVEVSTPAVATTDADVGETCPVMLRPSGRILRGKLVDKDHVVATESS